MHLSCFIFRDIPLSGRNTASHGQGERAKIFLICVQGLILFAFFMLILISKVHVIRRSKVYVIGASQDHVIGPIKVNCIL